MARRSDIPVDAPDDFTPPVPDAAAASAPVPAPAAVAVAFPVTVPPTLEDAFYLLCEALCPHLEDNLPAQVHAQEIQGWHANGNVTVAWQHAVQLLEQVLGQKLVL